MRWRPEIKGSPNRIRKPLKNIAVDWERWLRKPKLYAEKGEEGVVIDTFFDNLGRSWKEGIRRTFAKVKIGDKIKTFRTTSLDKI